MCLSLCMCLSCVFVSVFAIFDGLAYVLVNVVVYISQFCPMDIHCVLRKAHGIM